MSSSEPSAQPHGRLEIRSRAGVEFQLLDGQGAVHGQGAGSMTFDLPEGLYAVEWLSAGARSETLVRVLAEGEPAVATFDIVGDLRGDAGIAELAPAIVKEFGAERPSQKEHGSAITVIVSAESDPGHALEGMRLCNHREVAMRADRDRDPLVHLGQAEVARCYGVPPGDYLLAFRSATGETLQQCVPALPGRQTLVFLNQVSGPVLLARGEGFITEPRTGIDAARTVMISAAGDEPDERIRERLRLARVLLHDIASGSGSLGADFLAILDDPKTDPLLRLFAVIVTVSRLEARQSPASDQERPRGGAALGEFNRLWLDHALRWLSADAGFVVAPDEIVVRWRLDQLLGKRRRLRTRRSIASPPMLAQVWRWAAARSADYPEAVSPSPANVAAARSASGTEPWLCWKPSAAKAPPVRTLPASREIAKLANTVAAKAGELTLAAAGGSEQSTASLIADLMTHLSPEAGVAMRQVVKSLSSAKTGSTAQLAASLGLPSPALARRLVRTGQEIDSALEWLQGKATQKAEKPAKARSRPVMVPDDPQKGRFGGAAVDQGFEVTATFATTRRKDWIRITIEVTGPAADGEIAQIHLHDSFQPQIRDVTFEQGCARLVVTAWGGFTLGVWMPQRDIELELDLAQIPDAPRAIRTR